MAPIEQITNDKRFLNALNNAKWVTKKFDPFGDGMKISLSKTAKDGSEYFYVSAPPYFKTKMGDYIEVANIDNYILFRPSEKSKGYKVSKNGARLQVRIFRREETEFMYDFLGAYELNYNSENKIAYICREVK